MAQVKTLVITGYGTNCERECAFAADQAGSDQTTIVYFSDLAADKTRITDYNFLVLPGGFLDGDDLGSAQAAALRWRHMRTASGRSLMEDLKTFMDQGGIILGICNGFQLLVIGAFARTGRRLLHPPGLSQPQRFGQIRRPLGNTENQRCVTLCFHQGHRLSVHPCPTR